MLPTKSSKAEINGQTYNARRAYHPMSDAVKTKTSPLSVVASPSAPKQSLPCQLALSSVSVLTSMVRHIEPFAEQSNKGVKFDVRENQITVSAQSLDYGTAATEDVVCAYSGEPFEMTFKTESITNFCSYMETSDVVMKIESPYRGVVVEPLFNTSDEGEDHQNYEMLCLVMPMTTL